MIYLSNAFSINMLDQSETVQFKRMDQPPTLETFTSAVGHADTAAVFSSVLNQCIEANRCTVTLSKGDTLIVGQYSGPRLPEGATSLPEGATIIWWEVSL